MSYDPVVSLFVMLYMLRYYFIFFPNRLYFDTNRQVEAHITTADVYDGENNTRKHVKMYKIYQEVINLVSVENKRQRL